MSIESKSVEVKNQGNILFISPQPQNVIESLGFPPDDYVHWFESALGISKDGLRSIDATTSVLPSLDNVSTVFVGGSGYSAYETNPWQVRLESWLKEVVRREIPLMAVCYGHQSLARSQGGNVVKDPQGQEFGVVTIKLTQDGENHPVFQGLGKEVVLYSSHGDIVLSLPENAKLLATNRNNTVQAVAIGDSIVGIQPHPEFREDIMLAIAKLRTSKWIEQQSMTKEDVELIINNIKNNAQMAKTNGEKILQNFLNGPVKNHFIKIK